jgi:hypothetical protein
MNRDMAACVADEETTRAMVREAMAENAPRESITIQDVGPIAAMTIAVRPGVTCLRGRNDLGKSEGLKAVSRLAGGSESVSCRDKAACGYIEGLGVKIAVRQAARRTGELEALSLEGELNIADLVSPPIKDAEAADRARIKALLRLTGVKADVQLFGGIFADEEQFDAACTPDVLKCDDVVEMAARIKRNLESASRAAADSAEKADNKATACKSATDGVDVSIETDAVLLQATLEDALHEHGRIVAKAQSASETKSRAEQAAKNLETMKLRDRMTPAEMLRRESEAGEDVRIAKVAVATAEREIKEAEARLAEANNKLDVAKIGHEFAEKATQAHNREEELLAGWEDTVAQAGGVECPTPEAIAAAETAVTTAREAIEQAAVVRAAKEKSAEARKFFDQAKTFRRTADGLREAARATDDVLSAAVASDSLSVKAGRLITQHPERGEVFYAERSTGTRWKLAINEAIKRIRRDGCEQTAIIVIPQVAWSELDPENRAAIHAYAVERLVMIVTAEATDGELRAEPFGAEGNE